MEINKEDLNKIYDKGFIQVFAPPKSNYESVQPILQMVIDSFNITDLTSVRVVPDASYNPYIQLIKDIIYNALPSNQLWSNIFRIEQVEISNDCRHGSISDKSFYRYIMQVEPKSKQLDKCNSTWVHMNYDLVNEFLGDNESYEKLINISQQFPITLAENEL